MAQEITTTIDARAIAAHPARSRVASLHALIDRDSHYRDTLPAPLSPTDRKDLEAYRRDLHATLRAISMAKAEQTTARAAVGTLLQTYINARSGDYAGTLDAYVAFLRDQPLWAILAALEDFRHGRVFDLDAEGGKVPFTIDHAPSAARILDQVKKHTAAMEDERGRVMRLLAITKVREPEISEAERERVAVQIRLLADQLTGRSERDRAQELGKTRAEAEAARARAKRIVQEAATRRKSATQVEAGQ